MIFTSPKAVETLGVIRIVDDGVSISKKSTILMKENVSLRIFTDSRPLLESTGSTKSSGRESIEAVNCIFEIESSNCRSGRIFLGRSKGDYNRCFD